MTHDETFRARVRAAADPDLAPGAAERIAAGAWDRAVAIRAAERRSRFARPFVPAVAAAAALIAAVVLAVRGSTPAFAVEGEPVQVLDGEGWREMTRVRPGSLVYASGRSELRGAGGTVISPRPGSLFRIAAAVARGADWRVEMRSGEAEVTGSAVVLNLSDDVEVTREPDTGSFRVFVAAGRALERRPSAAIAVRLCAGTPSVRVLDGTARVVNLRDAEFRILGARETLASVLVRDRQTTRERLVFETSWKPELLGDIARGAMVVSATERPDGDVALAFDDCSGGLRSVVVPGAVRADVLEQVSLLQNVLAQFRVKCEVSLHPASAAPRATYESSDRTTGERTLVEVYPEGAVVLDRTNAARETFESLAALRAAHPDVAALFGDRLR